MCVAPGVPATRHLHHTDQSRVPLLRQMPNGAGLTAVYFCICRKWLRGKDELQSFAALLWLLKESGLELIETSNTVCILTDQATGLVPELVERSVQMALNGPDGESIDGKYGHCHNYLFARL